MQWYYHIEIEAGHGPKCNEMGEMGEIMMDQIKIRTRVPLFSS